MKKNYKAEDYIYSCARVRTLENSIVGAERCARLAETKTAAEFFRALEEHGIRLEAKPTEAMPHVSEVAVLAELENVLTGMLSGAFSAVAGMAPQPELFNFLRYPYDCHNIKAVLKSSLRGTEPERLLFPFGSISAGDAVAIASQRDFSLAEKLLPPNMAAALAEAAELYSKTGDPQFIDVTLDKACFADMAETSKSFGCEFFVSLVETKIDLANLLLAIRLLRMRGVSISFDLYRRMSLRAARLSEEFFAPAFDVEAGNAFEREQLLVAQLKNTQYESLSEMLGSAQGYPPLSFIEKQCDDYFMQLVRSAQGVLYGPEPLGAYIIAREYETRNLRILAAGKLAGQLSGTIKERLRASYV
ncbi:MAG TPA: V-type ATPase subunit [Bacillota bacterium]|nr:V-type ATPase subunit [Bacillota bacterium]